MTANKTQESDTDVQEFLASIEDETRRSECQTLLTMMQEITGKPPRMWGGSIIGFGKHPYTYTSGRSGEWFDVGFSPRKQNLTIYLTYGFEQHTDLLERLGKHSYGKACLYLKRLKGADMTALHSLIVRAIQTQHSAPVPDS